MGGGGRGVLNLPRSFRWRLELSQAATFGVVTLIRSVELKFCFDFRLFHVSCWGIEELDRLMI